MKEGFSFVLVAAGKGKRLGGKVPKQFAELAGLPMWEWSARLAEDLWKKSFVKELVLVVPPEELAFFREKVELLKEALKQYAEQYGPLTIDIANDRMSRSFEWVMQPWPWEVNRKGGC